MSIPQAHYIIKGKWSQYKVLNSILDLIFPKKCVGCNIEGTWFCQDCFSKISYLEVPFVRLSNSGLDGVISVAHFQNPLKEAIHAFKYDGVRELASPLSRLITAHLQNDSLTFLHSAVLVPVPLHKSKEIERGFNQSVLLAEEVGKNLNLKVLKNILIKTKRTPSQTELKKEQRKDNIKNVFACTHNAEELKVKTVLLVDDVITTGSTLQECAKVLKKAGASAVWGVAVAKG